MSDDPGVLPGSDGPDDPAKTTRAFYGRWARAYDWLATAPGVRSWRAQTVERLALAPGDTVVEMGCGTGANLPYLREQVGPGGRIVGIDLTRGMLDRADERRADSGWANVHLAEADATDPPIDGPVDAVLATFVVGMFDDPAPAVERWLDLLAPDGRIALLNAGRSDRRVAAPLNRAFAALVRTWSPGDGTDSGVERLERRVGRAREVVFERCEPTGVETFGLGYLGLAWGEH